MQAVLLDGAFSDKGSGEKLPQAGVIRDEGRHGGEGQFGIALVPAVVFNVNMTVSVKRRQGAAGQHIPGGHMADAGRVDDLGIHAAGLDNALEYRSGDGASFRSA